MGDPASHRISVLRGTQDTPSLLPIRLQDYHLLRLTFPRHSSDRLLQLRGPTTPVGMPTGLGYSAFARHYSQNLLFSSGYLDVSVHRVPSLSGDGALPPPGFPIRTSITIAVIHTSLWLFAVYHVLLRHLTPRHPPYALSRFSPASCDTEMLTLLLAYYFLAFCILFSC